MSRSGNSSGLVCVAVPAPEAARPSVHSERELCRLNVHPSRSLAFSTQLFFPLLTDAEMTTWLGTHRNI